MKHLFKPTRSLTGVLICVAALLVALSGVSAQTPQEQENPAHDSFLKSHQAGVRLGGWSNQGALPLDSVPDIQGGYYRNDIAAGSFYLEGFLGYRLNRFLMLEFSLGLVSRGDVYLVEGTGGSSIGTLQLYPILAKLKVYPFPRAVAGIYPYVVGGGGFYYGRHDIQFVTGIDAYYRAEFGQTSQTDFNYVVGGGADWPVASVVAIDLNAQYMAVKFSENLIGVRDYSSFTVTVGVKYLFTRMQKQKHPNRPY